MISTLFALGLFLVGAPFMAVAGLLAWDDARRYGRGEL